MIAPAGLMWSVVVESPTDTRQRAPSMDSIGFGSGTTDDTSFGFSVQGVYAFDFPERKFSFLPRAVVPVDGEVLQRAQRIPGALQKDFTERCRFFVVGDRGQDSDGLDEHPVQKTELKFFKF